MTPGELEAYLRRIGFAGAPTADFPTLARLQALHPAVIPFESLDPLLGRPVRIDPASVHDKLVLGGRGGYCFEHNGLFQRALTAVGFEVTPLAARVRWKLPEDAPPTPVSHMLLKVDLGEGPFICDVGFGGQSPTGPLRFEPHLAQQTPHGGYRIVPIGDGAFDLQMQLADRWATLYRFTLERRHAPDYEVANWFTSTHPQSRFTNNLIASRAPEGRRLTLFNTQVTTRHVDGRVEEAEIRDADGLRETLAADFGLRLSADEAEAVWRRLSRDGG
jgi:N-hydroxyarylamine O-acetyltransferase